MSGFGGTGGTAGGSAGGPAGGSAGGLAGAGSGAGALGASNFCGVGLLPAATGWIDAIAARATPTLQKQTMGAARRDLGSGVENDLSLERVMRAHAWGLYAGGVVATNLLRFVAEYYVEFTRTTCFHNTVTSSAVETTTPQIGEIAHRMTSAPPNHYLPPDPAGWSACAPSQWSCAASPTLTTVLIWINGSGKLTSMSVRKSKSSTCSNSRPARKSRARVSAGKKLSMKAEADRLENEGLVRLLDEGRKIKGPTFTHEQMLKRYGLA